MSPPVTTQRKDNYPFHFSREHEDTTAALNCGMFKMRVGFVVVVVRCFLVFFFIPRSWMKCCVLRGYPGPTEWDRLLSGWINTGVWLLLMLERGWWYYQSDNTEWLQYHRIFAVFSSSAVVVAKSLFDYSDPSNENCLLCYIELHKFMWLGFCCTT